MNCLLASKRKTLRLCIKLSIYSHCWFKDLYFIVKIEQRFVTASFQTLLLIYSGLLGIYLFSAVPLHDVRCVRFNPVPRKGRIVLPLMISEGVLEHSMSGNHWAL